MTQDQSASRSDDLAAEHAAANAEALKTAQEIVDGDRVNIHVREVRLARALLRFEHINALLRDLSKSKAPVSEQRPSEQGSKAIALIALLGDTAPIRRWKEYEDRGEERIPCFIDVETAKAIAEFFPQSNERSDLKGERNG